MSLRDAIRDAVDERNKQSGSDAASANHELASDDQTEVAQVGPRAVKDAPAKTLKTKPPARQIKPPVPQPTGQQIETPPTAEPKKPDAASSKAVNTASSKTVQEVVIEGNTDNSETESIETAALTVRVPRSHRVHWLISAKKENTSLTAAITEALNARFGEPTD